METPQVHEIYFKWNLCMIWKLINMGNMATTNSKYNEFIIYVIRPIHTRFLILSRTFLFVSKNSSICVQI